MRQNKLFTIPDPALSKYLASLLFTLVHKFYAPEKMQFPNAPCSFLPLSFFTHAMAPPRIASLPLWLLVALGDSAVMCHLLAQVTYFLLRALVNIPPWHLSCCMLTIHLYAASSSRRTVSSMRAETKSYSSPVPREPRSGPGQALSYLLN